MFENFFSYRTRQYPSLPFGLEENHVTRAWVMMGLFLLAIFVILMPAYYFDTRQIDGASVWAKPLKFSLSLAIHFFTLAILMQQLVPERRVGISLTLTGYAAVIAALFEQIYISLQAGKGLRSHFNHDTNFEYLMYQFMGVGAVLLIVASFTLGVMICKYGNKDGSGFRLGAVIGLVFGSFLTAIFAGYLSAQTSHSVGDIAGNVSSVPLVGWSRTNGDLRVSHFVATHTMQILPIVGFVFDRINWRPRLMVMVATAVLTLLSVGLFALSLSGRPVFPA